MKVGHIPITYSKSQHRAQGLLEWGDPYGLTSEQIISDIAAILLFLS